MTRFLFLLVILIFVDSLNVNGQVDNVGAGHALIFDGSNDYIDFGNIYDNLQFPITVSA